MLRTTPLLLLGLAVISLSACGGGGTTLDGGASPTITSIEPASGGQAGGTPIVIQGANLANPRPGEYQVLIGGQPAVDVVVVDDGEVECKTPPGAAGAAEVVVANLNGEGNVPGGFTYYPLPTVTAISPTEGTRDGGVFVTVEGSGFLNNDPGETACLIGLKPLDDQVIIDDSTLTGLTPTSWTEVPKNVDVVNRNGQGTLANGFTYVGPVPAVYSVTPVEGPRSGGTAVTIVGDYFTEAGGELNVRFGSAEAALVTRVDDQTLTCVSPLSAVPGYVDVAVGNNNGESSLPDAFYYIPAPELTLITPDTGSLIGGTSVTIGGTGFTALGAGTTIVTIGDNPVLNMVIVDDSTITCDTPGGDSIGAVNVRIVNGNGTSTLTNAFTYTAPCWWETPFGTSRSFGDDSSLSTSLGITFPFYGSSYSSLYQNSNGSLTAGFWSTYSASARSTYNQISGLHRDMYPPSGGTLYYKTLADRFVATWNNLPPLGGSGLANYQVHCITDGTICVLYNGMSVTTPFWCGIQPGLGGTISTTADLSDGPNTGTSSQPITENFSTFDMDNGFIVFVPDGSGGYVQSYVPVLP